MEQFVDPEAYAELVKDQAELKAQFCLRTGIAPSEYDNLTFIEVQAFIKEANKQAKRKE